MHPKYHAEIDMCYLRSISRINHIVEDIQKIHFKSYSAIPYKMMKSYCTSKLINR